jgi:hypothetical protein
VSNNDIPNFIGKFNNRESTAPLRERFKFAHIPSNAKIYTVDNNNPYIELFEMENEKKSDRVIPIEKNKETQLSTVASENSSTPVETSNIESGLQHDEDKASKCGNLSRKFVTEIIETESSRIKKDKTLCFYFDYFLL